MYVHIASGRSTRRHQREVRGWQAGATHYRCHRTSSWKRRRRHLSSAAMGRHVLSRRYSFPNSFARTKTFFPWSSCTVCSRVRSCALNPMETTSLDMPLGRMMSAPNTKSRERRTETPITMHCSLRHCPRRRKAEVPVRRQEEAAAATLGSTGGCRRRMRPMCSKRCDNGAALSTFNLVPIDKALGFPQGLSFPSHRLSVKI